MKAMMSNCTSLLYEERTADRITGVMNLPPESKEFKILNNSFSAFFGALGIPKECVDLLDIRSSNAVGGGPSYTAVIDTDRFSITLSVHLNRQQGDRSFPTSGAIIGASTHGILSKKVAREEFVPRVDLYLVSTPEGECTLTKADIITERSRVEFRTATERTRYTRRVRTDTRSAAEGVKTQRRLVQPIRIQENVARLQSSTLSLVDVLAECSDSAKGIMSIE